MQEQSGPAAKSDFLWSAIVRQHIKPGFNHKGCVLIIRDEPSGSLQSELPPASPPSLSALLPFLSQAGFP